MDKITMSKRAVLGIEHEDGVRRIVGAVMSFLWLPFFIPNSPFIQNPLYLFGLVGLALASERWVKRFREIYFYSTGGYVRPRRRREIIDIIVTFVLGGVVALLLWQPLINVLGFATAVEVEAFVWLFLMVCVLFCGFAYRFFVIRQWQNLAEAFGALLIGAGVLLFYRSFAEWWLVMFLLPVATIQLLLGGMRLLRYGEQLTQNG